MSLMIDSARFIKVVQHLIKEKGLTQAELAEKSGLSRSQLSRLLSGKNKRVQQSTVDKVLAGFEISKKEFLALLPDKSIVSKPKSPPQKTIYSDRLPTVVGQFIGRAAELEILDEAWANTDVNILQFIAPGGTGKTKLLREWLNTRRDKITSIMAWSFYSQGASIDKQISTSPFFDHALKILNAEQKTFSSDEDKGDYLATLLREKQCLLVLDGLEPLQHADAANRGELKDRALARLLKNLAGQSGTFCVITSRIAVYELSDRVSVKTHKLQNLEINDALALLKSLAVHGNEETLLKAVKDYAGHALALSLLGNLLRLRYRGDISKLDALPNLLQKSGDKTSRHAFKVMKAYEEWFEGTPELSVLYILGLFDHPVETEVFEALWRADIVGLSDRFQKVEWLSAIDSLRHDHRILANTAPEEQNTKTPQTLDCHPLIREYFGGQLEVNKPESWRAAHEYLYEYYKTVPEQVQPDTLEKMRPLFHAIKHGCSAGLHQKTFVDVYLPRVSRGTERYLSSKLGGISDEIALAANYFKKPWDTFHEGLSQELEHSLIPLVAVSLNALGRAAEVIEALINFTQMMAKQKEWERAVILSKILSNQHLTLGRLTDALETAKLGIRYSDYLNDPRKRAESRALYAKTLHQIGDKALALSVFKESEDMYLAEGFDSLYPYSTLGYYDLMIDLGESSSIWEKLKQQKILSNDVNTTNIPILEVTLATLTVANIVFLVGDYPSAIDAAELVVTNLYKSGRQDLIPLGLLTRAKISRKTGDFSKSHQDLKEVYDIANSAGMRLYLTDYHLEMAQLLLKQWQQKLLDDSAQLDIQKQIASAVKLIEETGYHRRDAEIEALIGPSQEKQKKWSEEW